MRTDIKKFSAKTNPILTGWFHATVVFFSGASMGMSVYIGGSHSDDALVFSNAFPPSSGDVVLGRTYTAKNVNFARCSIDELYFWDRSLIASEIRDLFNSYL